MRKEMSKVYEPKDVEKKIYRWWEEKGYFKPEVHDDGKPFTIIMPPPNITGELHMGHAFDGTLQDVLTRYKRMQGYAALWLPGMDHASIATEVKVVENIWETEGVTKEELGREAFLDRAWAWAAKYRDRIREQTKELGASCDWDRERFTMDEGCSEAVKKTFVDLYNDGYIYKGSRIINWCPDCKTALSDAEVEYSEQDGHLWHIRYPIKDSDEVLVVATTRPETMLGDTGVAVNPEDERYQHLVGKTAILPLMDREMPIVADDYVDMSFGTGVVKMTPAHDPNDYEVGQRHNLEEINILNEDGSINELGGPYAGLDRYEARKKIVADLEALNLLEKVEDHLHNVGGCYRCDTAIETMTSEQWFVQMQPLAAPAIDAVKNGDTKFVPDRFSKIYFNWMENIRDWCISRQLWWGHQIPAYYCDNCGKTIVALEMPDTCPDCGSTRFTQDEDVLDTWFSSALWPFSTLGWPQATEDVEKFYPNTVLVTGYDIIFFWVARMIFMGLYQKGEVPFADVYIHGLVRDSQGRKMSKSLGNGIDPLEVIVDYSADALRFTLMTGNSAGNDIRWQEDKLLSSRNFLNKIWNAARFVLMNTEENIFEYEAEAMQHLEISDKWILSRFNDLCEDITENMDRYEMGIAASKLYDFTWNEYCDWYIELVKFRLYGDDEVSKKTALFVLNKVLLETLRLLHPFIPFITEEVNAFLPGKQQPMIVAPWPTYDEELSFPQEVKKMAFIMEAIKQIRNIRSEKDVPHSKKAVLYVAQPPADVQEMLETYSNYFISLASVSEIKMIDPSEVQEDFISMVVEQVEMFISLDDLVDKEKEIQRLEKEKEKLLKELQRVEGKLNNPQFVSKAPEKVVAAEREKQQGYAQTLTKVEERLKAYGQ